LLARGTTRKKEIGIRIALGAGRLRIISQLLAESLVLSLLGAAAGVLLAWGCIRVLLTVAPSNIPRLEDAGINPVVLAYTVGTSMLVGILFGIIPALKASQTDPQSSLNEGGRTDTGSQAGQRTQSLLVIAQVALAIVLLAGAGLLIRSFLQLRSVDPGFRADRVLSLRVVLWSKAEPQRAAFYNDALARLQALPGVDRAAWVSNFFFSYNPDTTVIVEGRSASVQAAHEQVMDDSISPGYFQTVGIPVLHGRAFTDRDAAGSALVAVVNETMARRFWPDQDPVGKRFQMNETTGPRITVVGVVGDTRRNGLERAPISQVFLPAAQSPSRGADLVVKTSVDPLSLASAVRAAIRAGDPTVPVFRLGTLERWMDEFLSARRFETVLLLVFAVAAVVLSAIGIFGVLHYFVVQRKREIAIRMALGAQRRDVLAMVLRRALQLSVAGTVIGVAGGIWATRILSSVLYGVTAADPATWIITAAVLVGAALAASYIPASRAAKSDPLTALRD
jgi:putative ABC transport system permease protein